MRVLWMLLWSVALQAVPPQTAGGLIQGRVFDAISGQPLSDAQLVLTFVVNGSDRNTKSDEAGSFIFNDVPPGQYELKAELPKYLTQRFGQVSNEDPIPRNLRIDPNSRQVVTFAMTRAAVISGRIYDADRRPIAKVEVRLLAARFNNLGDRYISTMRNVQPVFTDDQGEYRFSGVQPGDHYIKAAYRSSPVNRTAGTLVVTSNNLSGTYYPGVSDPGQALAVKVSPGADLHTVDFSLISQPPFKVSGRIVNPIATNETAVYDYFLVPRDAKLREIENAVADQDPRNDRFEFQNVPPGSYTLFIGFRVGDIRTSPQVYSGRVPIDLVDRDVTELTVAIDPGVDIKGEVKVDLAASGASLNMSQIQPLFGVTEGTPGTLSPTAFLARGPMVQSDGTFQIPHAATGKYRLVLGLGGAARGFYVSGARLGSQDVLGRTFEVNSDTSGPLVIELNTPGGTIAGIVTNRNDQPASGVEVVLVPPISFRQDQTSYKTAITGAQGNFTMTTIRPGVYTLFAFPERVELAAIMNTEFIAPYLNYGISVEVSNGQTIRRDLTVMPYVRDVK
jgi:hypothetical protein